MNEEQKLIIARRRVIATSVMAFVFFCIIIYAISISIDYTALMLALIFSCSAVFINPDISDKFTETPILIYYSIFLSITLFFSIDDYKSSNSMMLLLITNILVCMGVFLGGGKIISYLYIFTNFYVITRIFIFYSKSPEKEICPK